MEKRFSFNKNEHIRKTEDIKNVYNYGKSSANQYAVMYILDRKDGKQTRMGWVLSKKVGKAHHRLRVKRLIREVFRLNKAVLKKGFDIILLPRRKISELRNYSAVEKMLLEFWGKRKITR